MRQLGTALFLAFSISQVMAASNGAMLHALSKMSPKQDVY